MVYISKPATIFDNLIWFDSIPKFIRKTTSTKKNLNQIFSSICERDTHDIQNTSVKYHYNHIIACSTNNNKINMFCLLLRTRINGNQIDCMFNSGSISQGSYIKLPNVIEISNKKSGRQKEHQIKYILNLWICSVGLRKSSERDRQIWR